VLPYVAAITFSSTDMFRNSRRLWKVRAIPFLAMLCGSCPAMDCPANLTSPELG
jgi:hypothetical protein